MRYTVIMTITVIEDYENGEFHNIGTATEVEQVMENPAGRMADDVEGLGETARVLLRYAVNAPEGLGYGNRDLFNDSEEYIEDLEKKEKK